VNDKKEGKKKQETEARKGKEDTLGKAGKEEK